MSNAGNRPVKDRSSRQNKEMLGLVISYRINNVFIIKLSNNGIQKVEKNTKYKK